MTKTLAATVALVALLTLPGQAQQTPTEGARPTAPDTAWFTSPSRFGQQDGAALYNAICAGCHMPDGRGAVGAGAFPALAGNTKLEAAGYPLSIVANGLRGMPPFGTQLNDAQIAAVVTYVRTHLGNSYTEPVTAEDARAARSP
jgi:mono/diheme cytochrome c family protein